MNTILSVRLRWLWWLLSLVFLCGGGYLFYRIFRRALTGETDAIGLVLSFAALATLAYLLLRNFWTVILDDRDLLDVFKDAAIGYDARIRHVRTEHPSAGGTIVENGYRLTFNDRQALVEALLVKLGRKQPEVKELTDEHSLLVIRVEADHGLHCAIVNPKYEIRESADIEHYAPIVLGSKTYSYYPHGIIFSDYEKKQNDFLFDREVMNIQLINLFVNYRFKFIVFDRSAIVAVKSAVPESLLSDIEAHHSLLYLCRVVAEQFSKSEFQTVHYI